MDMQWGADGAFYLLTYGDGFFNINLDAGMYKWEYAKGQRAPKAVLSADKTNGAVPLTVNFSSAGSLDEDPGESIRYEWDFGDGSPISEEANPTHTYTKPGRFTAMLTRDRLLGQAHVDQHADHRGQHRPDGDRDRPIAGGTFAFGDKIPYMVTVTDPEDGTVLCSDVITTFVLGHDTHGHGEEEKTGCSGILQTIADDVSHGGNVFGVISATYTDKGGRGANSAAPPLTTVGQTQISQRNRRSSTPSPSPARTPRPTPTAGPARIAAASRPVTGSSSTGRTTCTNINSITFRVADTAAGRTAGSPLAAIEVRQDSITGPILATHNLVSTGGDGRVEQPDVPDRDGRDARALPRVPRRHERPDGEQPVQPQLRRVQRRRDLGGEGPAGDGTVGGSVPATLSLTLGAPATFGAFTPGVAKEYTASTTANVISSAGDAALSVAPSPAFLTNGAFSLAEPLQVSLSKSAWTAPTSNEQVDIGFKQLIKANDPLRTGSYSKTLTFTLSTTTP